MQTPEGAAKARATLIDKYGEDYFKNIGAKGGKLGNTGGFHHMAKHNPEMFMEISQKGGQKAKETRIARRSKGE